MVGLMIMAGGQSRRMGHDKALMAGGLRRLIREAKDAELDPVVVLAGPSPRGTELCDEGHIPPETMVMDDPPDATCLHDVLVEVLDGRWPAMLLCPCDAVLIDAPLLRALVKAGPGVPLDHEGQRQPLFAHLPEHWSASSHPERRAVALMDGLPSLNVGPMAQRLQTANTPQELAKLLASRQPDAA